MNFNFFIKKYFPSIVILFRIFKNLKNRVFIKKSTNQNQRYFKELKIDGYKNIFCGYYDHSPFCPSNENLILCHGTNSNAWQNPSKNQPLYILLIDIKKSKLIKKLGKTYSWNWQQGARANWISNKECIYNIYDSVTKKYSSIVVDIETLRETIVPFPVQEFDQFKNIYSISFEALAKFRPDYGYRNIKPNQIHIDTNKILKYNIFSKSTEILIHINELRINTKKIDKVIPKQDKINHLLCSPEGRNLIFLYRYYIGNDRITDLYKINLLDGLWVRILSRSNVSHFCWINEQNILFTGLIDEIFGYYTINIKSKKINLIKQFSDGHPCMLNTDEFITDTYPGKNNFRHLYYVNKNREFKKIISFSEPILFQGQTRCDFHPSLSPSKKYIQIDISQNSNTRSIAIVSFF